MNRNKIFISLGGIALFALVGFLIPSWALFLLTIALAKSLAVLSVVLLMRAGLVSFGQGIFFAASAYTVAFALKYLHYREGVTLLVAGIVISLAIAALTGLLLARYRAIFFAMLTMAFSMILYGLLVNAYEVTSGTDGLPVRTPTLLGITVPSEQSGIVMYLFTILVAGIAIYLVYHYFHSPLGSITRAIQNNEIRIEYLGLSVKRAIYVTYLLSAALAGASGALMAFSSGHVEPIMAYWSMSGEFAIIAVLGGTSSVFAPLVGAILFEFIRTYAFKVAPYSWQIVLGLVLMAIILFMPGGLWTIFNITARRIGQWRLFSKRSD